MYSCCHLLAEINREERQCMCVHKISLHSMTLLGAVPAERGGGSKEGRLSFHILSRNQWKSPFPQKYNLKKNASLCDKDKWDSMGRD